MATTHKSRTNTWTKSWSGSARKTTRTNTSTRANYTNIKNDFQNKINSYRTLYTQTQGMPGAGRPSPATLNTFGNWINKGAIIHTVSATQINRWSQSTKKCTTAAYAKNVLWNKFGKAPIKAVCKSKAGSYIVATTPTYKGKNFKFPH